MKFRQILVLASILISTPAWAEKLLLTHVTLIDGTGADPHPGTSLLIEDGKISKIVRYGGKPPAADRVINLQGRFVMPGLVDSHYHLIPGVRTEAEDTNLRRFALLGGITAVRDLAGDGAALASLAKAAENAATPSPRIFYSAFFAGPTWFANDKRASIMMHGLPTGEAPWARQIRPETNIPVAVAQAKASGATGIKLYADLSPAQVTSIAAEARRQGMRVWSHATIFPAKPSDAVAAGVDTLSHANLMVWEAVDALPAISDTAGNKMVGWATQSIDDPRIEKLLRSMKDRGVIFDDTLVHARLRLEPAIAKDNPQMALDIDRWVVSLVRKAHAMGIDLAAGTDFQEDPDDRAYPNIHDQMALLVSEAGLKPFEALRAASYNGAKVLGQQKNFGILEEGKRADLVVIRGDPRRNMKYTHDIEWVMKGGVIHTPDKPIAASGAH